MFELATRSIWTIELLMESFAKLSLVILWYIWLLIQFFSSMCKGAAIFKDAFAGQLPIFA